MKSLFRSLIFVAAMSFLTACGTQNQEENSSQDNSGEASQSSSLSSSAAPVIVDNQLSTESGLVIKFSETGARISSIELDRKQIAKDGFTVGRCANRIANGKFTLNGTEYNVTKNNGSHSLHGGGKQWSGTFANSKWTKVSQDASSIKFSFHSADKADGYPGNMDMTVTYTLSQAGELSIEYGATSDQDTLCNPTNHLYMTLNGGSSYSNLKLWIDAENYTPVIDYSNNQVPTGAISPVEGTQFDYRTEKAFDSAKSYDDNYVLKANPNNECRKVATMTGTVAKVDVYTDRAGLQLYKAGQGQVCLESQQLPDWINQPTFSDYGTTILRANAQFSSKTIYHFSKVA